MGMGYSGDFAVVMSEDFIKTICAKEYQDLIDILDKEHLSQEELALGIRDRDYLSDEDETLSESLKAYDELIQSFREKTKLEISINSHDSENDGDKFDQVDGAYWEVDFESAYQRTPAAEQYKDKMAIKHFVVFG